MPTVSDPHAGQPVLRSGASPKDARLAAIMLHGRGASAEDILGLAHQFSAGNIAYVAPEAAGSTGIRIRFSRRLERTSRGSDQPSE